jgi:hypothetical protein
VLDQLVLELLLQVLVMVLPPERFAEIGGIDFHLLSFGHVSRVVRTGLFFGFRFWSLLLRLVRFLNRANVLAP